MALPKELTDYIDEQKSPQVQGKFPIIWKDLPKNVRPSELVDYAFKGTIAEGSIEHLNYARQKFLKKENLPINYSELFGEPIKPKKYPVSALETIMLPAVKAEEKVKEFVKEKALPVAIRGLTELQRPLRGSLAVIDRLQKIVEQPGGFNILNEFYLGASGEKINTGHDIWRNMLSPETREKI